ncbi:M50 family metallopeptidase [Aquibacillus rhizosphaerae]|uniref:M50 family metallopeptidase n=1 Tax=Aquibacillus rhizosphaerae TaxID=3051431 RepID=A0ABT7L231_9BACI|nr:M50 family metallopeptidase [Aquibacillus sp. LR5S19]MDL4839910.1 M50 family metallopeptidase [Aquibacillus sp. LR5S19]MDL4840690.1 M50 family metallopeptidase [Aquibacillus sp. LR5S19]MDL4840904.1 M50 family metallopeptidase [Aquibacillus sp. LR5S19]MDL4841632.1 M50 family metallopeptidase [Aquibacillus sp. LR5S19]
MDSYIQFTITFLLFVSLILPLTTLVHELGHALTALILFKEPVGVRLGSSFKGTGFKVGKLTFKIQPLSGWVGFVEYNIPKGKNNIVSNAMIMIAGPFFSFILGLICYISITFSDSQYIIIFLLKSIMNASLVQFIITILPIKYPSFLRAYKGMPSDGYRVMKLIMSRDNPKEYKDK